MIHKPGMLLNFCCVALRSSFRNAMRLRKKKLRLFLPIIVLSAFFVACSNNSATGENKTPANDSSAFYPVNDYFASQLKQADSSRLIIYTYSDSENKKDSTSIDAGRLKELAKPFFENDINDKPLRRYYRESVFKDETTESFTFSYVSLNPALPVQSIDVLLDTNTNSVKRVFITRNFIKGDTAYDEKLSWKTDKGFYITRMIKVNGKENTQQLSVMWQNK